MSAGFIRVRSRGCGNCLVPTFLTRLALALPLQYPQNDSQPVSKTPSRHAAKVPEGWKPSAVSGSPQAASQRHVAGEAARGPAPGGQKDESRGGASFAKTIKKQLRGKNFLSSFRDLSKKGRGAASPHTQQQHKKPLLEEQRADAVGHTARKSLKEKVSRRAGSSRPTYAPALAHYPHIRRSRCKCSANFGMICLLPRVARRHPPN